MKVERLLSVVIVAFFLSSMGCAMSVVFSLDSLHVTEPIACPEGTTIESRKGLQFAGGTEFSIVCTGEDVTYDVTLKALFTLWGIFFLPILLLVTLIGMAGRLVRKNLARDMQVGRPTTGAIIFDGQVYASVDDMPADVRQTYEQVMMTILPQRPLESREQRLKELKEMLDAGLITAQEYEVKKADILSEM